MELSGWFSYMNDKHFSLFVIFSPPPPPPLLALHSLSSLMTLVCSYLRHSLSDFCLSQEDNDHLKGDDKITYRLAEHSMCSCGPRHQISVTVRAMFDQWMICFIGEESLVYIHQLTRESITLDDATDWIIRSMESQNFNKFKIPVRRVQSGCAAAK